MSDPVASLPKQKLSALTLVRRIVTILLVAYAIGFTLNWSNRALEKTGSPAGFGRGLIHGILMPAAMPNLLFGHDITIYSANNTGIPYKLGYTMGVNLCGAVFFGLFFWRINRWRKMIGSQRSPESAIR